MEASDIDQSIRAILAAHGALPVEPSSIGRGQDLFAAGMKSASVVNVMLAVEEAFDFETPEERLTRATFSSIQSIADLVLSARAAA